MSPAASKTSSESPQLRAHVVVNRRARRLVCGGPLLAELCRARAGIRVTETRSLGELEDAAGAIARSEPGAAVVFAGGDGSHMAGVSALAQAFAGRPLPPVALAPGGTVGTVARNWGAHGDPVSYTRRLLDALVTSSARTVRRPTLRVRDHERERIGFIVGAGLVARFFAIYDARGGGNLAAAQIALRVFAGSLVGSRFARSVLDPVPCALDVDGRAAPFDGVSLVCASVVRDLGLGMRLTYRAGEALDRFHVVATPLGPRALGPQAPLVLAGRALVGPRVDTLARDVRLRFGSGEGSSDVASAGSSPDAASGGYVLDGELFYADAIAVTVGPELDVIAPRSG